MFLTNAAPSYSRAKEFLRSFETSAATHPTTPCHIRDYTVVVQAAYPRILEDPQRQHVPYDYNGAISRDVPEEHNSEVYLGPYLLSSSQAQFVREIYYVTPRVLIDHDYRRVISEASDPSQLYSSILKKPEAVEKELPAMEKFIQDSVAFVDNKYGKAEAAVDDPVIFFRNLGPKFFMAVKVMEIDGFLRASLKELGIPNNKTYIDFYVMVLQNPLRLRTKEGQRKIEEDLGLCSGTVQRLKTFFYEETTIYSSFRKYVARYVGPEEHRAQERIQEVLRMLMYAKLIQKALDDNNVTLPEVMQELKKIIQMDQPDGKIYLGSGVAAQAIEVIMKDVQRVESGLFLEDPMQKITNRGLL